MQGQSRKRVLEKQIPQNARRVQNEFLHGRMLFQSWAKGTLSKLISCCHGWADGEQDRMASRHRVLCCSKREPRRTLAETCHFKRVQLGRLSAVRLKNKPLVQKGFKTQNTLPSPKPTEPNPLTKTWGASLALIHNAKGTMICVCPRGKMIPSHTPFSKIATCLPLCTSCSANTY